MRMCPAVTISSVPLIVETDVGFATIWGALVILTPRHMKGIITLMHCHVSAGDFTRADLPKACP